MESILKKKRLRLYVALYALDGALRENGPIGPQEYWWTFLIAPENMSKEQECIRYRVKKIAGWQKPDLVMTEWQNEKGLVPNGRHDDIVARVLIGEIGDAKAVDEHIWRVWPIKTIHVKKSGTIRTSQDWVHRALKGLGGPSPYALNLQASLNMLDSKLADWKTIESCCTGFAKKAATQSAGLDTVPTFDMLKNQEIMQ